MRPRKKLIEDAYLVAPQLGLAVWTEDEAGPYPTAPYAGQTWHQAGQALRLPHEHLLERHRQVAVAL
jgi:hypothetical protein